MTKDSKTLRKKLKQIVLESAHEAQRPYELDCGKTHEILHVDRYLDVADAILPFFESEIVLAKKEAYEEVIEFVENSWDKEDLGTYDYKYAKAAIIPNLLKDLRSKFLSESPKEV